MKKVLLSAVALSLCLGVAGPKAAFAEELNKPRCMIEPWLCKEKKKERKKERPRCLIEPWLCKEKRG